MRRMNQDGWALLACGLTLAVVGCSKDEPTSKESAPEATRTAGGSPSATALTPAGAAAIAASGGAENAPAPSGDARAALTCDDAAGWEDVAIKALQTGTIQLPKQGTVMPALSWKPCDGKEHCERLDLGSGKSLLAVGALGNDVRLAVKQECDAAETVTIAPEEGAAAVSLRGLDFHFETAVLGGDRFLLGGYAKHVTEKAKAGFVPREYYVTGRMGDTLRLEAARNKKKGIPVAAASQFVQVDHDGAPCTTLFWKLGVEQCDFEGPPSKTFAMLGSNMIYEQEGRGVAWDVKRGTRDLLPALEWISTDGVNVVWSAHDKLYTKQPRWDLPDLNADPAPGAAGDKPVAIGCSRVLQRSGDGFALRNIQKGNQWLLGADRFPEDLGRSAVMSCNWVVFDSGYRVSLTSLGTLQPVPENSDPASTATTGAAGHAGATDIPAAAGSPSAPSPKPPAPSSSGAAAH